MEYVVQPGDTIYEIGRRFGFTVDQIVATNPGLKDPNLIYPGEVLELPEPSPGPGHPPWCGLVLWSNHSMVSDPAMALIFTGQPCRVRIAARKLPQPKMIRDTCAKYVVWIMSSMDPVVVRTFFVLQPAYFADVWFAEKEVDGLTHADYIHITAEAMECGQAPGGPLVMGNHMGNCCHGN
ncbi:MAG: LysM domain-containing protein [Peptococcaceae bacterium]|jgi:LysM repeat protein|nr:LysM domain-containing protein [Peptococcaceae bacterium]